MKKSVLFGGMLAAFTMLATASGAATVTPVFADCDPNLPNVPGFGAGTGQCSNNASRTDADAINFGAADGSFYSLGLSNASGTSELIIRIDPAFRGPASIVEVTNPGLHKEAANVFVAREDSNGDFDGSTVLFVGQVNNGAGGSVPDVNSVSFSGVWNFLIFQDQSTTVYSDTRSTDGYDIDAVTVSPVPLPAAGLLLMSVLGGLGLMGRRRSA
ncbi:MAG: VPLPA-CTERM sorting domain-containing protein [Pseudomonadota bacterium]